MFDGFRSRCTRPRAWMKESPSHSCATDSHSAASRSWRFCSACSSSVSIASRPVIIVSRCARAAARNTPESGSSKSTSRSTPSDGVSSGSGSSGTGSPTTDSHSRRLNPSTNSIDNQGMPSSSPTSSTRTMFGCVSARRAANSRRSRVSASGSAPGGSIFKPTVVPVRESVARKTAPSPPRPTCRSSRNGPNHGLIFPNVTQPAPRSREGRRHVVPDARVRALSRGGELLTELQLAHLRAEVGARPLPRHAGIIMDGNGRWAEQRGLPRLEGHRRGSDSVRDVTRAARKLGLPALTLYAFSAQNWNRPPDEVSGLMDLLRDYLHRERPEIMENGIRLHAIGELDRLPPRVRDPLEELRRDSARNADMVLTLGRSCGGRDDIIALARRIAADQLDPATVDARAIEDRLWTEGLPPLELVVRTSGEFRVSNFLLWQLAYAEIHFTDALWPDFCELDLLLALEDFQKRERRFGKTSAQLRTQA